MIDAVLLAPYEEFIQHLREYRMVFDNLAAEARENNDFHTAKECLIEAIKMRTAILNLEQVILTAADGVDVKLPEIPKVYS